jgi:hypothetical protein
MSHKQSRRSLRGNEAKIEFFGILFGDKELYSKRRESQKQAYPGFAGWVPLDSCVFVYLSFPRCRVRRSVMPTIYWFLQLYELGTTCGRNLKFGH